MAPNKTTGGKAAHRCCAPPALWHGRSHQTAATRRSADRAAQPRGAQLYPKAAHRPTGREAWLARARRGSDAGGWGREDTGRDAIRPAGRVLGGALGPKCPHAAPRDQTMGGRGRSITGAASRPDCKGPYAVRRSPRVRCGARSAPHVAGRGNNAGGAQHDGIAPQEPQPVHWPRRSRPGLWPDLRAALVPVWRLSERYTSSPVR